jgi:hypothetical protein
MTHNEALALIDVALHPGVIDVRATPPAATPEPGSCWIVGEGARDAWAGCEGQIAAWTVGGWRFVVPREGMLAWVATTGRFARFGGNMWHRGAPLGAAIPLEPIASGGAVVDAEARTAIASLQATLTDLGLVALPEV